MKRHNSQCENDLLLAMENDEKDAIDKMIDKIITHHKAEQTKTKTKAKTKNKGADQLASPDPMQFDVNLKDTYNQPILSWFCYQVIYNTPTYI